MFESSTLDLLEDDTFIEHATWLRKKFDDINQFGGGIDNINMTLEGKENRNESPKPIYSPAIPTLTIESLELPDRTLLEIMFPNFNFKSWFSERIKDHTLKDFMEDTQLHGPKFIHVARNVLFFNEPKTHHDLQGASSMPWK